MDARTGGDEAVIERAGEAARTVVGICSKVLGDPVGAVLHGSLTLGDYHAERSDVDLLIVVERLPADDEISELLGRLLRERLPTQSPIDLRVVTRATAASPSRAPFMELYLRLPRPGPAELVEVEMRGTERDLVIELAVCRSHGRTILGAEPVGLIGEVPDEWVIDVGDAQLADWQNLDFDPRYAELMVLTACRVWRFAEKRHHCSKIAAGEWALSRDSELVVVRRALEGVRGGDAPLDEEPVRDLLAYVRARVKERRASPRQMPDQREG